jgi:predicted short-subunit dehydrogenase-like oxidoreductase (DUF2520 family)
MAMIQGSSRPKPGLVSDPSGVPTPVLPTLGIIGAGRVGNTLARMLTARGYVVTAVHSQSRTSAERLADAVGAIVVDTPVEVVERSELIWLTVPDAAISAVCSHLASNDQINHMEMLRGRALVHTSGAVPVSALLPAKSKGALIGGFHPIHPIAHAIDLPPGVTFGLEADREPLRGWLLGIVLALEGNPLWLRANTDRARYHASAVLVSNYLVTLFAEGLALLSRYTLDEEGAKLALLSLAEGALDNLHQARPADALTGPIVRGDAETVSAHLDTLQRLDPELAELYRLLGLRTLKLAAARGLPAASLAKLKGILNHANDNP